MHSSRRLVACFLVSLAVLSPFVNAAYDAVGDDGTLQYADPCDPNTSGTTLACTYAAMAVGTLHTKVIAQTLAMLGNNTFLLDPWAVMAYITTPGIQQEDDCVASFRRQLQEVSGEALPAFFDNSTDLRLALLVLMFPILFCAMAICVLIFWRSWRDTKYNDDSVETVGKATAKDTIMMMLWLPAILSIGGLIASYALTSKHGVAVLAFTNYNNMVLMLVAMIVLIAGNRLNEGLNFFRQEYHLTPDGRFLTSAEEFASAVNGLYVGNMEKTQHQKQTLVGWFMSWVNKLVVPVSGALIGTISIMVAAATSGQEGQTIMYLFFFGGLMWMFGSSMFASAKKLYGFAIAELFTFTGILLQIVGFGLLFQYGSHGWLEAFTTADIHQNIAGLAWVTQGVGWFVVAVGLFVGGWTALLMTDKVVVDAIREARAKQEFVEDKASGAELEAQNLLKSGAVVVQPAAVTSRYMVQQAF